jgi:hypothetical protein
LKLNSTGQFIYAKQYPSETYSSIQTVNLMNNAQTLLLTGSFYGYFDYNPDPTITMMDTSVNNIADPFITMVDTAGNLLSFKKYNVGPYGSVNIVKTIIDSYNNFYVCGSSRYPIDFNFSNDSLVLGNNNTNPFVAKYNLLLDLYWAKMAYTNSSGTYNSIAVSGPNALLLHGTFDGAIDYNLDTSIMYNNNSFGMTDVFLTQMDNCHQSLQNLPVTACNIYTIGPFTYYQSSNVMMSFPSSSQCDSVINFQIAIVNPTISVNQTANNLTALASGAIYQWYNCTTNTLIPNATNQQFVATSNGNYSVIITQNGCTDTSLCYTVNGLTNDEYYKKEKLLVYPNPIKSEVYIDLNEVKEDIQVIVFDIAGREIYHHNAKNVSSIMLNLPFTNQTFFMKVLVDGNVTSYKMYKL